MLNVAQSNKLNTMCTLSFSAQSYFGIPTVSAISSADSFLSYIKTSACTLQMTNLAWLYKGMWGLAMSFQNIWNHTCIQPYKPYCTLFPHYIKFCLSITSFSGRQLKREHLTFFGMEVCIFWQRVMCVLRSPRGGPGLYRAQGDPSAPKAPGLVFTILWTKYSYSYSFNSIFQIK